MQVALLEPLGVSQDFINQLAEPLIEQGIAFTSFDEPTKDVRELARRAATADVVILANSPFDAAAIEGNPNLKLIDVAFTGIDLIDVNACRAQNVTVCNCAGYANRAVAELVLGMAIDCARHINKAEAAVRSGGTSAGLLGTELYGKRVGIIGAGKIGCETGQLFSALGCKVKGYARHENPAIKQAGMKYEPSLEELLQTSDIVSVHVPLTPETRGMIGAHELSLMKPTATLINCARGPVVDAGALAEALKQGKLGAAAVDVYDAEPPLDPENPLLSAPNCVLTPHIGFYTKEALQKRARIAFENVYEYLAGTPQNVLIG